LFSDLIKEMMNDNALGSCIPYGVSKSLMAEESGSFIWARGTC
jgi:hypothetical protein